MIIEVLDVEEQNSKLERKPFYLLLLSLFDLHIVEQL